MKRIVKTSLVLAAFAAVAITTSMHTLGALHAQDYRPAITMAQLQGSWQMTLIGNTGCGFTSMLVNVTMNGAGTGTANWAGHSAGCGDGQTSGHPFVIQSLNPNGSGTANLSCGTACGWEFNIQVAPDRDIFNVVDVTPANGGNFLEGTAIRQ